MNLQKLSTSLLMLGTLGTAIAQVEVDVNFDMKHVVGGQETFDRNKFITLHSTSSENDYNDELGKLDTLMNIYDAYNGRDTGRMRFVGDQVRENASRPGFADPASITEWGTILNNSYANRTSKHPFEKGSVITAAQDVPFYPNGANPTGQGWTFSSADTSNEPFGSALGQYMGIFMRDAYGNGGVDGTPRPEFVEVMNEPVWPLVDENLHGGGTIDDIFNMHLTVADSIRKYSPTSKIGGFCTAFPDLEKVGIQPQNNEMFGQWEERWRRFIDEVGPEMDFYSFHLYDFHSIGGRKLLRKGSNMEATMDMIEHYSTISDGEIKPVIISEYGGQLNDFYAQPWSPARDWLNMKSFSSMMMQFMERPDVIQKTIPFALHRADFLFGNIADGFAYPWRMMRRANEPADYSGDWVFTELVKFYQLWSDVKGTRVDTKSTDLDVMVDAYVDQASNTGYLILNNLSESGQNVNLNQFGLGISTVTNLEIKHLYLGGNNAPVLDITNVAAVPNSIVLNAEATMILAFSFDAPLAVTESSQEVKTYATTYKQPIIANQAIDFTIPNVPVGAQGEAVLRLGVGRALGANRVPAIVVNGTVISVPTDYRGDTQDQRDTFFGILEIEVPYNLLTAGSNTVSVTFDDDGGFVSSCALQTFDFSRVVTRSQISDRTRFLTFDNITDFTPVGGLLPEVTVGQELNLELSYGTGVTNQVEEDLFYIAAQVRQLDETGAEVATSPFTTLVPDAADNAGIINVNYTVPTHFDTEVTNPIPTTEALPAGHQLVLLLFMSTDNNTGFANANTEIIINEVPDRERTLVWDNIADYIPAGATVPSFSAGQDVPLNLSYATGLTDRIEEDLFYIATLVRQTDETGAVVAESPFTTILGNDASNIGTANFTYTIPTHFDAAGTNPLPTVATLPDGHALTLLIFMSVESDTGFADANTAITLSATPNRDRSISWDNKSTFSPSGQGAPTFLPGQTFSTTLTYATASLNDVEEDLTYVAMQLTQLDENFAQVSTSSFEAVIDGDQIDADTVTFDYTLPTAFDDGTEIPLTADLPTGHRFFLLIFMSVDGDTGFANDNTEVVITDTLPSRTRAVSFDNVADYIPTGQSIPVFEEGQTFSTTLSYATGIENGVEEDLTYVAMQISQLDENFANVNTSTFQAVVLGDEVNADTVTFDYTVPATFDDGTALLPTQDLPDGHRYFLLLFMSVDGDSGFANENREIIIQAPISDRTREITFDNAADFIPATGVLPTFLEGQTFSTTLTYATGVENGVEEDLGYVAMQVAQLDENFVQVNSSAFQAVVSGDEVNTDTVTFDYELPTTFEDGTEIPVTTDLPAGHRLFLLTFMSVNGDTGFANANMEIVIKELNRDRVLAWDNRDAYIPAGATLPTFYDGQVFSTTLSYATGIENGVEEDLSYVAMQLRQVDQSGGVVATSTFEAVVDGNATNKDVVTFDYTLPLTYDNGNLVLNSENLPGGHKLMLLIFMSVDGDTGFANADTEIIINTPVPDVDRAVTIDNLSDFIPVEGTLPTFDEGSVLPLDITYNTAIFPNRIEDLTEVSLELRQLDQAGGIVSRSTAEVVVGDSGADADTVTYDFTLPQVYDNGNAILISEELPGGHTLAIVAVLTAEDGNETVEFSKEVVINRFIEDRERMVTIENIEDYIPNGSKSGKVVFQLGATVPLDINYATAVENNIEEDLTAVRIKIQQLNAKGKVVKNTRSQRVILDHQPNEGSQTVHYTIPTHYKDGTIVPRKRLLPYGHSTRIVVKLIAEDRTAFAFFREEVVLRRNTPNYETANTISLYPNPTVDVLNIGGGFDGNWFIFSKYSKLGFFGKGNSADVSFLPSGVYFIKLQGENKARKFIKR